MAKIGHKTCITWLQCNFWMQWPFVTWPWPWPVLSMAFTLIQYLLLTFENDSAEFRPVWVKLAVLRTKMRKRSILTFDLTCDTRGFADLSQMVLNAYQTTQNCPLITNMATFFRCHVQFSRYKSLKSELWNNHWKPGCGSRKVSTNRCSKTPTIDILKCYWGYILFDWNPWLHFWGIKCFFFFVSHVSCHFSWIFPKISFLFIISNVR